MSRKPKYSFDVKVKACEDYINGERSLQQIAQDLGLKSVNGNMRYWISSYRKHGPDSLLPAIKNPVYTKSFKLKVVEEYIDGRGSIYSLAGKYGIKSIETLHRWILRYNSDMELKDYDPRWFYNHCKNKGNCKRSKGFS